jgi:UDP-glucuronate 4-epimerase
LEERFLVTGAEGCIGAWVLKQVAARGYPTVAVDISARSLRLRQIVNGEVVPTPRFVTGDVTDPDLLHTLVERHGITRIIHLAALQIPLVAADPVRGASVNVTGTILALEAARAFPEQVKSLVYASSAAVFGPRGALREPATLYGVFKMCNEDCAAIYARDFGVRSVGLRPWAVFGPGRDQGLTAAPTLALEAVASGRPFRIPFGGRLDLQFVEDVAETFVAAALSEPVGAVVCNLRGDVVDVEDFIALVEELRPDAHGLLTHADEPIPIEPELDDASLRALLGDLPRTDLKTAIARTLTHFTERDPTAVPN